MPVGNSSASSNWLVRSIECQGKSEPDFILESRKGLHRGHVVNLNVLVSFHSLGRWFHNRQMMSSSLIGDCSELVHSVPMCAALLELGLYPNRWYQKGIAIRKCPVSWPWGLEKSPKATWNQNMLSFLSQTPNVYNNFHYPAGFPRPLETVQLQMKQDRAEATSAQTSIPKAPTLMNDQGKMGHALTTNTYILNASSPSLRGSGENWNYLPCIWQCARM